MAVCDPDGGMHSMWKGRWRSTSSRRCRAGTPSGSSEVRALFEQHEFAGVIVEPIVQGAGGMRFHPPECVRCCASSATSTGSR